MTKIRRLWWLLLVVGALGLAALACEPGATSNTTQPSVTILSPEPRSNTAVDEPLEVDVMAEDPLGPGVIRLDLQLDGLVVDTFEAAGPQAELGAMLEVTPSEEGPASLSVIAYREDGTASDQVSIALSVTSEASPVVDDAGEQEDQSPEVAAPDGAASEGDEPASSTEAASQPPSPNTQAQTGPPSPPQTSPSGDDEDPPPAASDTGPACGDGTCNEGEDCISCFADCGICPVEATVCGDFCSNGVCDPVCGENADNCHECDGYCGDGVCQTGSEDVVTCQDDCFNPLTFLNVGHCPDGVCDPAAGENALTCTEDCYDFCGDGFCSGAEFGTNLCPEDCS